MHLKLSCIASGQKLTLRCINAIFTTGLDSAHRVPLSLGWG